MKGRPTLKILFKNSAIISLFFVLGVQPSLANLTECLCFEPYLGVDAGVRNINYNGGGNQLFKTNYPQAAIYAGFKFLENFGLEAGYKSTFLKSQFVRLESGDVLGQAVLAPPEHYIAKSKFKGWYGSLIGYLPLCDKPIDFIGSIGFTRLRTYHYRSLLVDQVPGVGAAAVNFLTNGRTFKAQKTLLTLGLGAQYVYCDTVGFRIKVDWENTSKIRNIKPQENPNSILSLNLKNSIIYNFGIFFPF